MTEQSKKDFKIWLTGSDTSESFSSMWKNLIKDFNDNVVEDMSFFKPSVYRSYNFVTKNSHSFMNSIHQMIMVMTYFFTKALQVFRNKTWQFNVNGYGNFPAAKRFLEKNHSFQGYLEFCKKHDFVEFNSNAAKCYYCSTVASKYLNEGSKFLEIGAGTGATAAFLLDTKKITHYAIIDLPHMIQVSSTTLKLLYPDVAQYFIFPGSEVEIDESSPGIYFITHLTTEKIPADFFDMVMNLDSMQEMNEEQVNGYIELVQKIVKRDGYFLNINRRKHLESESYDNNPLCYPYKRENKVMVWETDPYFFEVFNLDQNRTDGWIKHIEQIKK